MVSNTRIMVSIIFNITILVDINGHGSISPIIGVVIKGLMNGRNTDFIEQSNNELPKCHLNQILRYNSVFELQ